MDNMAKILVKLTDTGINGHASVCIQLVDILEQNHEVDLLINNCHKENAELDCMNDAFGTSVSENTVMNSSMTRLANGIKELVWSCEKLPNDFQTAASRLADALYLRHYQSLRGKYDIVLDTERRPSVGFDHDFQYVPHESNVSSEDTKFLSTPTIHNDNTPTLYYRHNLYRITESVDNPEIPSYLGFRRAVNALCKRLVDVQDVPDKNSKFVSNSEYTAGLLEEEFNIDIGVLYPPTDLNTLSGEAWSDREEGIVTVGRISPYKNQLRSIRIVNELIGRGRETHLHVVGKINGPDATYSERFLKEAEKHDFVHFEGEISNEALIDLLGSHKYGLHGKEQERFGIVIAEMVAAGMIPFVHASGGQREIVDGRSELQYVSVTEAADQMTQVMDSPELKSRLRTDLSEAADQYSKKTIRRKLNQLLSEVVESTAR